MLEKFQESEITNVNTIQGGVASTEYIIVF
ncbi:hypothetical protein IMCC3317_41880 [Kordia antarctica]|uniref:Uncharacterized protein n=1 Tax=Kordia antarctica TaxID=1218801 RepID=A0A7L4ZPX5_9FLAO|nr:hypothetical protein IMCC3317_41880 [Kordia antarctica]